jgi:AGZA family xanthine/uracil permease-like MFS transporter
VLYGGLEVLGEGAILGGLILGAIAVFIIERDFAKAAAFSGAGAVMTFFGFMHGPAVGIAVKPGLALAYLMVAGLLYAASRTTAGERLLPVSSALPAE